MSHPPTHVHGEKRKTTLRPLSAWLSPSPRPRALRGFLKTYKPVVTGQQRVGCLHSTGGPPGLPAPGPPSKAPEAWGLEVLPWDTPGGGGEGIEQPSPPRWLPSPSLGGPGLCLDFPGRLWSPGARPWDWPGKAPLTLGRGGLILAGPRRVGVTRGQEVVAPGGGEARPGWPSHGSLVLLCVWLGRYVQRVCYVSTRMKRACPVECADGQSCHARAEEAWSLYAQGPVVCGALPPHPRAVLSEAVP